MKIKNVVIDPKHEAELLDWMSKDTFQARQLEAEAKRLGYESEVAMRLADRLIQKQKKAGAIRLIKRIRSWEPARS